MDNYNKNKGNAIAFRIFPSLNDYIRYMLVILLFIIGFYLQFTMLEVFPGILLIFTASLLVMFKGIDKRFYNKGFIHFNEWTQTTPEQINEMEEMYKKIRLWDKSIFEVSSCLGFFMFLLVIIISIIFVVQDGFYFFIGINSLVMFIPLYFSGFTKIDIKPTVLIKIQKLKLIAQEVKTKYTTFIPEYYLQLAQVPKKEKPVPSDFKIKITPADAESYFLGLYGQCSLNLVGGVHYPYVYYVLVYKKEFGLKSKFQKPKNLPSNVTMEITQTKEVEVLIIRQTTTKTSGYSTGDKAISYLLSHAIYMYQQIK